MSVARRDASRLAERFFLESRNAAWLKRVRVADVQNAAAVRELDTRARAAVSILAETPPATRPGDLHRLPAPAACELSLYAAAERRRTDHAFAAQPLRLEELSTLLYLCNGQQAGAVNGHPKRIVPTAGNLGSVTVYLILLAVHGIEAGIYRFDAAAHGLAAMRTGDFRGWLRRCVLLQEELADASAFLVLSCDVGRLTSRYGLRGARLALLDAGHASQAAYLAATALDLVVCATAGFIDDELLQALELDGARHVVGLCLALGRMAT